MIANKLEHQLNTLQTLVERKNGDLQEVASLVIANMRAEVERLKVLETSGVICLPESVSEVCHG